MAMSEAIVMLNNRSSRFGLDELVRRTVEYASAGVFKEKASDGAALYTLKGCKAIDL